MWFAFILVYLRDPIILFPLFNKINNIFLVFLLCFVGFYVLFVDLWISARFSKIFPSFPSVFDALVFFFSRKL